MNDIKYLISKNLEGEIYDIDPQYEDPEFRQWVAKDEMTSEEIEKMFEDMLVKNSIH